jgi:hypothetical protein
MWFGFLAAMDHRTGFPSNADCIGRKKVGTGPDSIRGTRVTSVVTVQSHRRECS